MFERWKAESYGLSPSEAPPGPLPLPASTLRPMDQQNPLLAMTVRKWMRSRGKTVKPKLTEEQTANLKMTFRMMDADGSGAIDADELHAAFKLLGLNVTKKEVEGMLDEVDRDGSGKHKGAGRGEEKEQRPPLLYGDMTLAKLNRMAEERDSGSRTGSSSTEGGEAEGGEEGGGGGTPDAAALPFDIVATAYRRKKLLEALDQDNKDFLRSVAEEEERRSAELAEMQQAQQAEAAAQQAVAGGRAGGPSRLSMLRAHHGEGKRPSVGSPTALLLGTAAPQTNAEFLQTLGRDERRMLDALARKFRESQEVSRAAAAAEARRRASNVPRRSTVSPGRVYVPPSNAEAQWAGSMSPASPPLAAGGKPEVAEGRPGAASPGQQEAAGGRLGLVDGKHDQSARAPSGRPAGTPSGQLPPFIGSRLADTAAAAATTHPPAPFSSMAAAAQQGPLATSGSPAAVTRGATARQEPFEQAIAGRDSPGIELALPTDLPAAAGVAAGAVPAADRTSPLVGYRRATAVVDDGGPGPTTGSLVQCRPSIFVHPDAFSS